MDPRVAIVIPIFRHSVLAEEAIASALALGPQAAVIAVDDGCPNAETRVMLDAWATRGPLHRISQANRGLSGARNTGINFALDRYPGIEAVFPLDADNRLDRHADAVFNHLLDRQPDADWFYPHFDMFGLIDHAHAGGPYSLGRMAESNHCEAGSLIRRRVFDAGVRFDETLRAGYEDWAFWLSAAQAGFKGRPAGQSFFRYRKRPESMLAGSHDQDVRLRAEIRTRNRWLYDRDGVAQALAADSPRYLIVETGEPERVQTGTVPADWVETTHEDAVETLLAARVRPGQVDRPPVILFARPGAVARLRRLKLLESTLAQLHYGLEHAPLAALRLIKSQEGRRQMDFVYPAPTPEQVAAWEPHNPQARAFAADRFPGARAAEEDARAKADMVMVTTQWLMGNAFPNHHDPGRVLRRIRRALTKGPTAVLNLSLEGLEPQQGRPTAEVLERFIYRVREGVEARRDLEAQAQWRSDPAVSGPGQVDWILRRNSMGGVPLPLRKDRRVGFVLPIFLFGGVEKCVVALAAALKDQGVACHLFVYGNGAMAAADWLTAPFETIHQITDPMLRDWGGPQYSGTNLAGTPNEWLMKEMLGPLAAMDAVVVTGCAALYHGLGALRGKGIKVLAWEHLLETGGYGRAYGTPYLALAYEGGLDRILTCSEKLGHWLHAQGVPRAKLVPIPNGAGFPMAPDAAAAARADRTPGDRLRVGFLGRFDEQKGADRYLEIARGCRHLPIDFSITGGSVIGSQGLDVPAWIAQHPAAFEIQDLEEAFARIDVLLMPSRGEGLPLTIFEAQRAGVIPAATDVGAVQEAIADGETGFLIQGADVVGQMQALLARLVADPALRKRLSGAGVAAEGRWARNAVTVIDVLDTLLATPKG